MLKHMGHSIWNCILIWKLYHGKQFQWQDRLIYVYKFDYEMLTITNEFTKFNTKTSFLFTKRQCFVVLQSC